MPKTKVDPANFNWLTLHDQGKLVMVLGHYTGDFMGTVRYGGREMAIITDTDGVDREVCYMHPVIFLRVE